jgi:hypothetical protein
LHKLAGQETQNVPLSPLPIFGEDVSPIVVTPLW